MTSSNWLDSTEGRTTDLIGPLLISRPLPHYTTTQQALSHKQDDAKPAICQEQSEVLKIHLLFTKDARSSTPRPKKRNYHLLGSSQTRRRQSRHSTGHKTPRSDQAKQTPPRLTDPPRLDTVDDTDIGGENNHETINLGVLSLVVEQKGEQAIDKAALSFIPVWDPGSNPFFHVRVAACYTNVLQAVDGWCTT